MLIQEKKGNLEAFAVNGRTIEWLPLEWYETTKRVARKQTENGQTVSLKFLQENHVLTQGDVLYADDSTIIAVKVLPCNCVVVQPKNMFEMAAVCYEIGNKHLPVFYEDATLLVPFEQPLYQLLQAQGYTISRQERQLLQPLRTTVSPHGNSETLFSKILKRTGA